MAKEKNFLNDTPGEYLTLKEEDRGPEHEYFEHYMELCDGIVYVLEKNYGKTFAGLGAICMRILLD